MSFVRRYTASVVTATTLAAGTQVPRILKIQHDINREAPAANSHDYEPSRVAYDPRGHQLSAEAGNQNCKSSDAGVDEPMVAEDPGSMNDTAVAVQTLDDVDSDTETSSSSDLGSILDTDNPGLQWVMSLSNYLPNYTVPCAPERAEVEAAFFQIEGTPIGTMLTKDIPDNMMGDFVGQVVKKSQDPSFRYLVHKTLESKKQAKLQAKVESVREEQEIAPEILVAWEQMVEKERCVICQDLLCAPMVLKCSHSFCFHCLQEYTNKCQPADGSAEVVHTCPLCPYEFKMEDAIFVRTMHDNITEEVMKFPAEVKKVWEEKFATYLVHEKKRQQEEKEKRDAERIQRSQAESSEERLSHLGEWEAFCSACVPIVTFIIILMLGFSKR